MGEDLSAVSGSWGAQGWGSGVFDLPSTLHLLLTGSQACTGCGEGERAWAAGALCCPPPRHHCSHPSMDLPGTLSEPDPQSTFQDKQ